MNPATDYLAIFQHRHDRFRELLSLSRQQSTLIAHDDYDALMTVLGRKQHLLSDLDRAKAAAHELMTRWRDERDRLDVPLRQDCERVLAETENLVAELVREEEACSRDLVARRDATRRELESVGQGTRANDAYRDTLAPTTHRHLDVGT